MQPRQSLPLILHPCNPVRDIRDWGKTWRFENCHDPIIMMSFVSKEPATGYLYICVNDCQCISAYVLMKVVPCFQAMHLQANILHMNIHEAILFGYVCFWDFRVSMLLAFIFIYILLTSIHLSLYDLHLRGPLKWALSSVLVWSSSPSFNLSLKDWAVTVTYFVTLSLCHACHSMSVQWVQNTCGLPRCRACRADPCGKPPVRQWFWNS